MVITNTGNVGIGTATNINNRLLVHQNTGTGGNAGVTCFPLRISAGAFNDVSYTTGTFIGLATEHASSSTWSKCGIGHVRTSGYDIGSIVFCCNNTGDTTSVTMSDERMRITSGGNVGIGTATVNERLTIYGSSPRHAMFINSSADTSSYIGFSNSANSTTAYIGLDGLGLTDTVRGALYMGTFSDRPTIFGTNSAERLRITSGGNVGIGTNNPNSTLHLYGSMNRVNSLYIQSGQSGIMLDSTLGGVAGTRAWNIWSASSADTSGTGSLAFFDQTASAYRMFIKGDGGVVIGGNLNVGSLTNPSDNRIKKDIEDINDESALNKLLLIQPTTYNYIDVERNKGFGKVYGFIAQQIREVIPEAVSIVDNIIPNIYRKCICEDNKRIYIVLPQEVLNANIKISDYGYYIITKIESDYIEVEDYSKINKDIPDGEQFVYGYEVKDFHTLNKDYIFTLNVCATQELHRRIEAQSVLLKSQDDRIKDLETKVATLISSM